MASRRLFFALWPSDRQREALRDPIKAAASPVEGRLVARAEWHVTLVFLGMFPEAKIAALQQAAAGIDVEEIRLRFDRLEFWPRPKIACLAASAVPPALETLVSKLELVAADFGYEPEDRRYRPHLTIARNARPFAPEPLARPVTLEWSGFELIESERAARFGRYSPLKQGSTGNS